MTPQRTKIDWLGFRTQDPPKVVEAALQRFYGPSVGQSVALHPRKYGMYGYEQAADVRIADMNVGVVAFGGEHQKGWVSCAITGKGCQWVPDWDSALEAVDTLSEFDFRRVDIALDTFKREVTHESAVAAYRSGGFHTGRRPPKHRIIDGGPDGRTLEVGTRERDKFVRGYEKGIEQAIRFPESMRPTSINGVPVEDWYRLELELKPKTAPLPADLVERRDQYFAGAYPFFQQVLAEVEPEIMVMRRDRQPQADLAQVLATIRNQYGTHLFTALHAYHGDIGAVMAKISGTRHNEQLLRAGVLLVDHE
jgi:DNA relaxase NicK